jgi:Domain of unknown function (DUF4336)
MIELAKDLYVQEARTRFFGLRIATRMTVMRLAGGRLMLHSPIRLTARVRSNLDLLGEVAFLVFPNKFHDQFAEQYQRAYPRARSFAAPGLPERRPELRFDGVLGDRPDPAWQAEIDQAAIAGNPFFREIVFLHRASRTLVVADLVTNFDVQTASLLGRMLARAVGIGRGPAASPEHRWYTDDPEAAARSLARVAAWDFVNLVLAHGALVEGDGQVVFAQVSRDLVAAVRRRGARMRRFLAFLARRQ